MGKTKFMGGLSIVCPGDFGKLPPVGQGQDWNISKTLGWTF